MWRLFILMRLVISVVRLNSWKVRRSGQAVRLATFWFKDVIELRVRFTGFVTVHSSKSH